MRSLTVTFAARSITATALENIETARLSTHCGSQKMTVAAIAMADMKVWAQRS